eukprot:CAMPEP_0117439244 /NCGR_PEP_ID=MMETSP0759-20121206/2467_1 /TAXON_ID=63605 /ORGANISM="Percolomonas cosmopolitus, Strain WS" /LENGTH=601 /DNA_ID=CAMNT_0005230957 /DNA_START=119 /DNA_END=1924 /DNA_ORIENTATION=-
MNPPVQSGTSVSSSYEFKPRKRSALKRHSEKQATNHTTHHQHGRHHPRTRRKPHFTSAEVVFKELQASTTTGKHPNRRHTASATTGNNASHIYDTMREEANEVEQQQEKARPLNPMSVSVTHTNGNGQPKKVKKPSPTQNASTTSKRKANNKKISSQSSHVPSQNHRANANSHHKPEPPVQRQKRRKTIATTDALTGVHDRSRKRKSPPIRRYSHHHLLEKDPFFETNSKADKLREMMEHLDRIKTAIDATPTSINTSHGKMSRKVKLLLEMPDFAKAKHKLTGGGVKPHAKSSKSPSDTVKPQKDPSPSVDMVEQEEEDTKKHRVRKFLKEERLKMLNELLLEEEHKREQIKHQKEEEQIRRKSLGSAFRRGVSGSFDARSSLNTSPTRVQRTPPMSPSRHSIASHMGLHGDDTISTSSQRAQLDERIQQAQSKKELLLKQKQEKINQHFLLRKYKIETSSKKVETERKKEAFVRTMEHLDKQQETYLRHEFFVHQKKARNLNKIMEQEERVRNQQHQQKEWKTWIEKQKAFLEQMASQEQRAVQELRKQVTMGVYLSASGSMSPKKRLLMKNTGGRRQSLAPLKMAADQGENKSKAGLG